jgi:hypothetical protein
MLLHSYPQLEEHEAAVEKGVRREGDSDALTGIPAPLFHFMHYWDADAGLDDPVELQCLYPAYSFTNAYQRAYVLWQMALAEHAAGRVESAYAWLGHVVHLLQDMTVPAHAHKDFHHPVDSESFALAGDSFELWVGELALRGGIEWDASDAQEAGGLLSIPSAVCPVWYLMYVANQTADYFASDEVDGDSEVERTADGHPVVDYSAFGACPILASHLKDNDTGSGDDTDGDLSRIGEVCLVTAIRVTATLLKRFHEALELLL